MRDDAPNMYKPIQARALAGTGGRANAIKCMCLQCTSWVRAEIMSCPATDCPLWHFRPYTPRQKGVDATLDYTNGDDESSEPLENA